MNNEERIYYVYKHTNLINGKVYIGQTRQEPEKRWKNGLSSYRHNAHFLAAIKKYGWENFSHEILKEKLTYKEMKYWEDFYVEYYDARNPEKGYNIIAGGLDSPFQELWNDPAFREKMSKQQSELMKERLKDPEKIELLRQAMKKYWSEHPERKEEFAKESSERMKKLWEDPEVQKKYSELMKERWQDPEQREKLTQHNKDNANKNWQNPKYRKKMCRAVINVETGLEFESGAAAGRWCNIDRSCITRALKSGRSSGKHPETGEPLHWKYKEELEE